MAKGMDLVDCARLFALTSMAGNDALVAVFDAKYALQSLAADHGDPQCRYHAKSGNAARCLVVATG